MYNHLEQSRAYKFVCLMLSLILVLSCFPMRLLADILDDEENTFITSSEDVQFEVEAVVTSTWDKHANVDFKIKNTGNETIHNWYFSFVLNYEIENIWNATIYDTNSEMGLYTIKNSDYNQEIRVNEEIIVGMTLVSDEEIDADNLISKWYLNTKEEQLDNSKFDVSYTEYSAWDSGFNGAITITNKTNETIKNWTLGFRRSSTINVVNQAVLEVSSENNYVITNDGFNTNISGNSSISFGIQGVKASDSFDISEVVLNYYTVNIGLKEDKDGNGVLDIVELLDIGDNSPESTITPEQTPEVTPTVEVTTDVTITPEPTVDATPEITEVVTPEPTEVITPELTVDVTPEVTPTIEEIDYELDSDGDGLPDYYEDLIYTDKNNPDSDGDGIGDFLELCIECNPLLVDSDNNGVNDGDEDYDGDGLTNVYEYMNNLNLQKNDSDGDGLDDYEEIYIYGTSPINFDTDSDGVSDYDELAIGKNPLSSQDGEERIYQSKIQDIVNEDDESIVKVEVELSLCGNIETELKIYDLYNVDMYQTSAVGRIGSPISFECEEEFDTAKVTFYYDEEALGDTREEDLMVLWYDETNNCYIEQEQATVDEENNTITLELEHFSTYIVANGLVRLELPLINSITMNMSTSNVDYIIAVDLSKGITAECRDEAIDIIEEIAYSSFNEGDRMYIFYYGSSNVAFTESKMTTYQEIDEYLKQVRNYIGNYEIEEAYGSFVTAAKGAAIVANSFPDVGNSREFIIITNDNDPAVSRSDFFSYVNAFYMNVTVAIVDNSSIWGAMFLGDIYFYNGTCTFDESFGGNNRDTIVSYPDSIDLITDNDGDEIPDYFEINGMLGIDGNIYHSKTTTKHSDEDNISDKDEVGEIFLISITNQGDVRIQNFNGTITLPGKDISNEKYERLFDFAPKESDKIVYVFNVRSNPEMWDSDADRIPDDRDEKPLVGLSYCILLNENCNLVNVDDAFVGGNQAWFAELPSSTFDEQAYKNACCGTVCGADIMAYYSLHGYPSLYAYPTFEQSNYLNHMYDVLEYVMPSSPIVPVVIGVNEYGNPIYSIKSMIDIIRENGEPYNIFEKDFYGYIGVLPWNLDEAVEEFAKSRNIVVSSTVFYESDMTFREDLVAAVIDDISSGKPIALNISSSSEISMKALLNSRNVIASNNHCSFHWLTIVGIERDEWGKDAFIVVSWGNLYSIYVDDILKAHSTNTFVTFEV